MMNHTGYVIFGKTESCEDIKVVRVRNEMKPVAMRGMSAFKLR